MLKYQTFVSILKLTFRKKFVLTFFSITDQVRARCASIQCRAQAINLVVDSLIAN